MSYKEIMQAIKIAEKEADVWEKRGQSIVDRYSDKRETTSITSAQDKRLNILWSNIQLLKPAYFAHMPVPVAKRRYGEDDPISLKTSIMLEKVLEYELDDVSAYNSLNNALLDKLLVGRGVVRLVYGSDIRYEEGEAIGVDNEHVTIKYIHWKDFLVFDECRVWEEVKTLAFKSYLTNSEIKKRFNVDIATERENSDEEETLSVMQGKKKKGKLCVYEVWNKSDNNVTWLCKEHADVLETSEPLLKLKDFFPCPMPMYATLNNDSLIPIPDFIEYQDQADELDAITDKIYQITKSLKVAGLYAGSSSEIQSLLTSTNNQMIPVKDWQMLAGNGGIKGMIEWFPVESLLKVLDGLYNSRKIVIEEIYQITGISDILRGQGQANETATAQRIKGKFATLRLQKQQEVVANFCRETICIMAEIIADIYSPHTLQQISNEQIDEQIMKLLHDDSLRGYRIDIEIDSTIALDEKEETANKIQFIQNTGAFLAEMQPLVQTSPEMGKFVGEMLLFGIRAMRDGRELEIVAKETIEAMMNSEPQPSEQQQQMQQAAQEKERAMQEKAMETQQKQQMEGMQMQMEQAKMQMAQQSQQMEQQIQQAKLQMEQQRDMMNYEKAQADNQISQIELQQKEKEIQLTDKELNLKIYTDKSGI